MQEELAYEVAIESVVFERGVLSDDYGDMGVEDARARVGEIY